MEGNNVDDVHYKINTMGRMRRGKERKNGGKQAREVHISERTSLGSSDRRKMVPRTEIATMTYTIIGRRSAALCLRQTFDSFFFCF
jgi:hypothetical protein